MSKDFSGMDGIIADIGKAKGSGRQQVTASEEEQAARRAAGRTQGRKGCRMQRINLAFSDENLQFIRTVSRAQGCTMTQLINAILDDYREQNQEVYEAAAKYEEAVRMLTMGKLAERKREREE